MTTSVNRRNDPLHKSPREMNAECEARIVFLCKCYYMNNRALSIVMGCDWAIENGILFVVLTSSKYGQRRALKLNFLLFIMTKDGQSCRYTLFSSFGINFSF